ncbi:hypothetical protein AAG906_025843 [Vitis piasezkii]
MIDPLYKANMLNVKSNPTPMCQGTKIHLADSDLFEQLTLYWSIIGALQYLTLTRLDISFVVNKLSQYLQAPTVNHWKACKCILRYLNDPLDYGPFFSPTTEVTLEGCPTLWCDSTRSKQLTSNSIFHSRAKHIEIDVHFIGDKVIAKELEIKYVPTKDQTADIFTKSLSISQFHFLKGKLAIVQSPRSRLREHLEELSSIIHGFDFEKAFKALEHIPFWAMEPDPIVEFLKCYQLNYNDHITTYSIFFVNQSVENLVPSWPKLIRRCLERTMTRCDPSS